MCLLYLLIYDWIIVEKDQWHEQKTSLLRCILHLGFGRNCQTDLVQHSGCQIKVKMDYTICFVDAVGTNPAPLSKVGPQVQETWSDVGTRYQFRQLGHGSLVIQPMRLVGQSTSTRGLLGSWSLSIWRGWFVLCQAKNQGRFQVKCDLTGR